MKIDLMTVVVYWNEISSFFRRKQKLTLVRDKWLPDEHRNGFINQRTGEFKSATSMAKEWK